MANRVLDPGNKNSMVNIIRIKPASPAPLARALLRAGKAEEAIDSLQARLHADAGDHAAWHQLALAQTQQRNFFAAVRAINKAIEIAPEVMAYQRFKGITLVDTGDCDTAIACLLPFVRAHPDDGVALQALQLAYSKSGKEIHAIALGRKFLKAQDATVMSIARGSPSADIMPISRGDARVISFSLSYANPILGLGAIANARLAQRIYPGWKCRIYVGQTVPANTKAALRQQGAEIVEAWEQCADIPPTLWPYLAADDPGVAVFLCRSCGARIGEKDAAAVDAWLRSGKRAHVMRDHILHRNLVLPGMWGARTDNALFVTARMRRFMAAYGNPPNGLEQRFLDGEIWPAIRDDCLIHDSYYPLFGAQPFPAMGKGNDQFHVGMGITGEAPLRREAQSLGLPWPLA